jgi:hypothetical protein
VSAGIVSAGAVVKPVSTPRRKNLNAGLPMMPSLQIGYLNAGLASAV